MLIFEERNNQGKYMYDINSYAITDNVSQKEQICHRTDNRLMLCVIRGSISEIRDHIDLESNRHND